MGRKVLIFDDEPMVLEIVASLLEDLGYVLQTASNGTEALDSLGSVRTSKYSLPISICRTLTDVS